MIKPDLELEAAGLHAHAEQIQAALKPVIYLTLAPTRPEWDGHRLGGLPYLPDPDLWPQELPEDEEDEEDLGYRKDFLLQLNLADLPELSEHPLPREGWLLFFIGSDETASDVSMKVLHLLTLGTEPTAAPDRTPESPSGNYGDLRPQALQASLGWALPRWDSGDFQAITAGMSEDEALAYSDFARTLEPAECVGGMFEYARALDADYLPDLSQMKLLLNVSSCREADLNFWDAGILSVYVQKTDQQPPDFSWVHASILTS